METAIKKEFSGSIEDGLLAIARYSIDRDEFFARCLHKSMVGLGTKDKHLIRLIVTRCELDLNNIKAEFQRLYGKSLYSWIKVRIFIIIDSSFGF